MVLKQSKVTYQGDEAERCCKLLTYIIVQILNETDLKNVLNNLNQFECQCPSVNFLADSLIENNTLKEVGIGKIKILDIVLKELH